jgi:hypothetical protein
MSKYSFSNLRERLRKWAEPDVVLFDNPVVEPIPFIIERLTLVPNPRYQGKLWGYRPESMIDKAIVHQELGNGNTIAVHNYQISKDSHLKPGTGAPKITYHFTIEPDGWVYQVNDLVDVVWHTKGQNLVAVGIMLVGDFDGVDHVGTTKPTDDQLASLGQLLDKLTSDLGLPKTAVHGHSDFGKPACPGFEVMEFINTYRGLNVGV